MNFNPLKMLLGRGSDEDEGDSIEEDEELFEDEGFDDFDEESDDFDDFEEDESSQLSDIQGSIESLETEVGSLSSTISVTKDDIESIGNRVDEVEENVKKLLDVYEMVTKDINPFVGDGEDLSNRDLENADDFGVFEGGGQQEEDFDDSFLDEDEDVDFEESSEDEFSDEGEGRQVITPDDLEEDSTSDDLEEDVGFDEPGFDEDQDLVEEMDISEEKLKQLETRIEMVNSKLEKVANGDDDMDAEVSDNGDSGEREYYLEEIKRDYYSDIVLMNWTNFLLTMVDTTEFRQILDVYVDLKWISPEVRDYVERFEESISTQPIFEYGVKARKSGTGNSSYSADEEEFMKSEGGMTVEDHTRSLIFISKLRDDEDALSEKNVDKLKKEIDDILKYNLEI
ncbi:FlaD/FlaE family flagellar protein [Methanonatronarchaeum sp. AMET-Sl]|uniref:FlaD/FlaE family flagellar protein n=1 Tax=Methanonatronarchaeum sp. AMET-Sl TaxID=3037654 RepID=UPI00244DA71E|nr:FlaD/FlaE family flagellar protein [Methanonatronarchaeum sp. AMET-Sl]WGI17592.1 FlaD/FlaE family flagellar protein [Methanonatronarchaeum sp. AMET-Sl]